MSDELNINFAHSPSMTNVSGRIHNSMRNPTLWGGLYLGLFGGVCAVAMDADHLFMGMSRQTHLAVVVAFAILSLWVGVSLWTLVRRYNDQPILIIEGSQ